MREIVDDVLAMLSAEREFALVTLVRRSGSAPRAAGAQMLVRPDGSLAGTIGGGLLEATMIGRPPGHSSDTARSLPAWSSAVSRSTTPAWSAGGTPRCSSPPFQPAIEELLAVCTALSQALREGRRAWLFTFFPAQPGECDVAHCLLGDDGQLLGRAPVGAAELRRLIGTSQIHGSATLADGRQAHVEPVAPPSVAVICGAGHVAAALAPVAAGVGFEVVVIDDRPEFADAERFPSAHRVVLLDDFEQFCELVPLGAQSYVVSVTRGHAHDLTVIAQALRAGAGYIGLMGSASKRSHIVTALAEQGFTEAEIARIHTPIGLSIGAETPAELAISIVAEMVQVRAAKRERATS